MKSQSASSKLKANKQLRRRWMTFLRMTRYGINNFSRNAWLTIAATAVMTITLIVVLITLISQNVFASTLDEVRDKVDISIFLTKETTDENAASLQKKLERLPNVASVNYISAKEAQQNYNDTSGSDVDQLKELSDIIQDEGPLVPASLQVKLKDLGKINDLKDAVSKDDDFQKAIPSSNPPSYEGKRVTIDNIASASVFAQRVGIAASVVFVIISIMIIFNTIRMAIFNRKEEIQMMKLIGADRSFIRGPFIVEAIMYGFFAAVISTVAVYVGVFVAKDGLAQYGIIVGPTVKLMETYPALVLLAMIIAGGLIGVISSQLAVRRYLKV